MAEVIAPPETETIQVPKDEIYTGAEADPADLDASSEPAVAEPIQADPPDTEDAPVEPAAPEVAAPSDKHSVEMVEQALRLQIPVEEIDEMSPKELQRAVTQLNRFGQHVWDSATSQVKKETAPEKAEAVQDFPIDLGKDENGVAYKPEDIHPAILNALRAVAKQSEEETRAVVDRLEQESRSQQVNQVQQRVGGLISGMGEEVAKTFDQTTAKGKQNYQELMVMMSSIHQTAKQIGKPLTEPQIFNRAVKAMDLMPAPKPSQSQIDEATKKAAWDKAALSPVANRGKEDDVYKRVGKILKKHRQLNDAEPDEETPFPE